MPLSPDFLPDRSRRDLFRHLRQIGAAVIILGLASCTTTPDPVAREPSPETRAAALPASSSPRPRPNFGISPSSYDPLFGSGNQILNLSDLEIQPNCCPIHATTLSLP